jgi:hypothetical protein
MNRVLLLWLIFLGIGMAQTAQPSTGKAITEEEVDKILAGKTLSECQQHFHRCERDLTQLQIWADENYPIGQRLAADNNELRSELASSNRDIRVRVAIAFAALGFGMFLAFLIARAVHRVWPLSFEHKQLAVLVLVAIWVSTATLFAVSNAHFWLHPISSGVGVGVWSLPALTFGAVAFWWFGKKHPRRLF